MKKPKKPKPEYATKEDIQMVEELLLLQEQSIKETIAKNMREERIGTEA